MSFWLYNVLFRSKGTFNALFQSLMDCGADKLCTENDSQGNSTSKNRKFRRVDEFLMVLIRLRLSERSEV